MIRSEVLSILLIIACDISPVSTQYVTPGECPKLPGMPFFNVPMYTGKWYEVEKYFFAIEATASCVSVVYLPNFDVEITMLEKVLNKYLVNNGRTLFLSKDGSANLQLDLKINQVNKISPVPVSVSVPYLVLDTDYHSYTIKYVCQQLGKYKSQNIWILSRDPALYFSSFARSRVHGILTNLGLNTAKLVPSDNKNCDRGSGILF